VQKGHIRRKRFEKRQIFAIFFSAPASLLTVILRENKNPHPMGSFRGGIFLSQSERFQTRGLFARQQLLIVRIDNAGKPSPEVAAFRFITLAIELWNRGSMKSEGVPCTAHPVPRRAPY
jgi:hypothetical protein